MQNCSGSKTLIIVLRAALCAGAPESLYQRLRLAPPDKFSYLRQGCSQYFCSKETEKNIPTERRSADHKKKGYLRDPMLDDAKDFHTVDQDLGQLGMSEAERLSVYTTIATVLHLGNIDFEDDPDDNRGGCRITDASEGSLQTTAELMGLDADELRRALTARVMQAAKGGFKGTVIMVCDDLLVSCSTRQGLLYFAGTA
jgi:myosin-6